MYRPDKSIIDNNKLKLFEELNNVLKEQKSIDIASAYFNVAGFRLIKDSLTNTEKFRLLIGTSPQTDERIPDFFLPEEEYKKNFRQDLEKEGFEKDSKETVVQLINLLKNPIWEVKLYNKGFLHGKAYIFDKLVIVGSSNFTYAGLTSNTELNAVLDEVHSQYIREEWFNKLWNESIDFKQELIKILDESKFGTKEYPPYYIFIKSLYELQKEDILFEYHPPELFPESEVDLANFQEDAIKRIYSRLRTYNGVLIADSVGLGKTWIAKKIIEDFGFYRRQRFLVVCPASVDDPLWRPALKNIGVSENIIHQEELGREDFNFEKLERNLSFKLEEISLIVIDESHNFRNPLSNRYEKLFTLIEKSSIKRNPKILLVTATPMNNTYWDLYFQLMLIARNNKRVFVKEGIFDLERQFKKADKGNISYIADILQTISIRRTRQYIKNNYPDAKYKDENGNWLKIEFPERKLDEINYSLDETYQGLYYKIAEKIENPDEKSKQEGKSLNLAYYRLEEYRIKGKINQMELGRMKALGGILQTILLKRLESSVEAFRKSIQTQIDFLITFKEIFKEGKILRKEFYNKYLAYMDEETEDIKDIMGELKKALEAVNLSEFDTERFFQDVNKDIKIFQEIEQLVKSIDKTKDAKLNEFKEILIKHCSKEKCIIFSFYADTIGYVYESLIEDKDFCKKFNKKISKVTGSFSTSQRRQIVDAFLNSDTDLLLSTDILSEGQNLQKARIVINYDLHWNPVRMIQRAGRIDRIGSPFKKIFIYNFYPEKELESLLELVKILQGKIEMINETIGLDASVLGEKINPKVFGTIRDLKGTQEKKDEILRILEEEQFGGGELFWQPLKEFGLEKLQEFCESLPDGIQSGLKLIQGTQRFRGIFFYYKYEVDYHLWFLYDVSNDSFITNKTEILNFISCKENEPRVIPQDLDVFEIHRKVREEIEKFFSEGLVATQIRTVQGRMEKTLRDMRDELDYIKTNYLDESDPLQTEIIEITNSLISISFTKKRMQVLRRIWKKYQESKNWHILIADLQEFLKEKQTSEIVEIEKFDPEKLQLICVDFIS